MSRSYLDSIRNPKPYPDASDTSNPPSRARTPVSVSELTNPKPYPRSYGPESNPPSRPRTPASIADLTNPRPYPNAYDNPVVKPTAVKATPPKPAKSYQSRDLDKPRAKRFTKTKASTRPSNPSTPVQSDVETRSNHRGSASRGGSVSSLNLELQIGGQDTYHGNSFTLAELDSEPVRAERSFNVEAGPGPQASPRTTSLDGPADTFTSIDGPTLPQYEELEENNRHKAAAGTIGGTAIDTTRSSHDTKPMTAREKKEKQAKAGGDEDDEEEEEVWYKRHEKLLWIIALVFFIVIVFFALGLGLALGGSVSRYPPGAFGRTQGSSCRFSCRNKAKYTERDSFPLILFAIDGIPKDLPDTLFAKNIRRMSECGVHTNDMIPAFASTAYPNLWSIITGRYPESHGVYSDVMTGSRNRYFSPRESQDDLDENEWYKAKPLWQTAREQGVLSASHSWLGNNMATDGNSEGQTIDSKPNYYQPYNSVLTPEDMIDTVKRWITQDDVSKIPQFITVFFEEPGKSIREFGMYSQQANDSLLEIDNAIGGLLDTLLSSQDVFCFNFMVASTSGLVSTSCGDSNANVDFLSGHVTNIAGLDMTPDYLNSFARITISSGANENWNTPAELSNLLKCKVKEKDNAGGWVYARDELPVRYHYSDSGIPDGVYVLMKDGKSFAKEPSSYDQQNCQYANDGYDPTGVDSTAVFIGFGQDFRQDYGVYEFFTVDLYNLMSKLLGLVPEPNNGTMGVLHHMLKAPGAFPMIPMQFAGETFCPYDATRVMSDYKNCPTCPDVSGQPTAQARGDAVFSTPSSSADRHIPFGAPAIKASVSPDSSASCKLYQSSYVLSFDKALTIGKFVSLTLTAGFSPATVPTGCSVLSDTRLMIGENPKCDFTSTLAGIKRSFLLQPGLSVGSADAGIISSNIAPLYQQFETDIWTPLINKFRSWTDLTATVDINVVEGPVYDINHDGIADDGAMLATSSAWAGDTVVPTHYFVVATRCGNNTAVANCMYDDIETLAFILPHNNMGLPCTGSTLDEYLMDNRATIQDVERITGLCFFSDWSLSDDDTIRRAITGMKSALPYMMWAN